MKAILTIVLIDGSLVAGNAGLGIYNLSAGRPGLGAFNMCVAGFCLVMTILSWRAWKKRKKP